MKELLLIASAIYIILHILKAKWQALLIGLLLYGSIVKETLSQSSNTTIMESVIFITATFFLFIVFNTVLDVLCGD